MTIFLFIKQALSSIFANKLRSFLSVLGIVIGISSFVIMLAIGEGAKQSILKDLGSNGNVITISGPVNPTGNNTFFTEDVAKEITEKVPNVGKVIITYDTPGGRMSYKGKRVHAQIKATGLDELQYKKLKIKYGSYFNKVDFQKGEKFIIIGNGLTKKPDKYSGAGLTGLENTIPIGKSINISGENFIIVGILEEKNWQFDRTVFMQSSTYKKLYNNAKISGYEVYVADESLVEHTKNNLNYFLYKKSGADKKSLPFSLRTNKESLKQINDMSQKFSLLLGGIGAIALIVGGIGIMNIMVVSVTERTREIGIRKAIGATNRNILFQFLVESIILTLFGSILAVLFSQFVVTMIGAAIPQFSPVINAYVLFIATCVSVAMGIIFGLMPAYKAAKLKPIDALHFE